MIGRIWGGLKRRILRPRFREVGMRTQTYRLAGEGEVQFAEWLHSVSPTPVITQEGVDFYKCFINKDDFAIDVGAHAGDTTVPMALAAGPQGLVIALDPNPHVFKILAENAQLNREKTNIVPLNFAAAARDTDYVFGSGDPCFINGGIVGYSSNRPGNTHYRFTVPGRDLAKYLAAQYGEELDRLSFVKVDTEGYDKEVLKNLRDILISRRPTVVAECFGELDAEERGELFDSLGDLEYRIFSLAEYAPWTQAPGEGTASALPELTRGDMLARRHFDLLGIPSERCPATLESLAQYG